MHQPPPPRPPAPASYLHQHPQHPPPRMSPASGGTRTPRASPRFHLDSVEEQLSDSPRQDAVPVISVQGAGGPTEGHPPPQAGPETGKKELLYAREVIWAVREGSMNQVEALLQAGANPNTCEESSGRTLLHLAVDRGDPRFVALLLHHRPNVKAVDALGETAFMAAARANRPELARMIKQHALNCPPTQADSNNFQYVATWATDGTGNRMMTPANVSRNSSLRTYPQPARYQEKTRSFDYSDHGYNTMTLPPPPPSSRGVSADTVLDSTAQGSVQMGALRCLCEHMADRNMPTPFLVGLFDKVGTKENYTLKLVEELSALTTVSPPRLKFQWTLVLGPAALSLFIGYIVGLAAGWQAGLGFGLSFFFCLIFLIGLIITGNRRRKWRWAMRMGSWLASGLRSASIFMHTVFCNPRTSIGDHIPVKLITVHQPLSADTAVACLASAVDKTYQQIERKYGSINSRLFRAFRSKSEPKTRFKSVCCVPNFIICLVFLLAFFIAATILRVFAVADISELWANRGVMACFIIMICVVCLICLVATPTLYRATRGVFRSARSRIKRYERRAKVDPDILPVNLKLELRHAAKLVHSFDAHLGSEFTRIVLILDGSNIYDQSKSIQCLNLLYSIFGDMTQSPFLLVYAGDIQALLSDNEMGLQEGVAHLDSARIILNLFVHLEDPAVFAGLAPDNKIKSGLYMRGGSSMESLSTTSFVQVPDQTFTTGKESLRSLTELILSKAELTELNMKHLPQLINTIVFKIRLLRLHQIEFKLLKVVIWVTLNIHWPFHAAWIIWYVEEQWEKLDSRVTLAQLYERIHQKVGRMRPLLKMFDPLDRDTKKLDFLMETMGSLLTVGDISKFLPLSLYVTPQLRKFIRNSLKNKPLMTPKLRRKSIGDMHASGCDLAMSPSSMSQLSSTWPRQVHEQTESATTTLNRTLSGSRRCLVKLKDGQNPDKMLSGLSIAEVCDLMSAIEGFASSARLADYQSQVRDLNITGLVLSVCDMAALQPELGMTFGDWQLFNTLVMHLREQEAMFEEAQAITAAEGLAQPDDEDDEEGAPSPPPPPPPHSATAVGTNGATHEVRPEPVEKEEAGDGTPGSVRSAKAPAVAAEDAVDGADAMVWKKTHRGGKEKSARVTTGGARLDRSWTEGGADVYAAGAVTAYSAGHRHCDPNEPLLAQQWRQSADRAHTLPQKPYQPPADLLFRNKAAKNSAMMPQPGQSTLPPPLPPPPNQQPQQRPAPYPVQPQAPMQPFQHQQQCKHYQPPPPRAANPFPQQAPVRYPPKHYPFIHQHSGSSQASSGYPAPTPHAYHNHTPYYSLGHDNSSFPEPVEPPRSASRQGHQLQRQSSQPQPQPQPLPQPPPPIVTHAATTERYHRPLRKQASEEEPDVRPLLDDHRVERPPSKAKSEERLLRRGASTEAAPPTTPTSMRSEHRPRSVAGSQPSCKASTHKRSNSGGERSDRGSQGSGSHVHHHHHHHHHDSESEDECTCEYWYRLEREGKVVLQQRSSRHPPPRHSSIPAPVLPGQAASESETEEEETESESAPTPPPHPPPKEGLRLNRHQTEYL